MRKHNRIFTWFATGLTCFVLAVAAASVIKEASAREGAFEYVKPPYTMPVATFYDAEGNAKELASLRGKVVIVHFWAKWCPPCIVELPDMQRALTQFEGKDVVVLPVSLDKDPGTVELFYKENNIVLPVVMDRMGAMMAAFDAKGLPSTFIISRDGKVIAQRAGVADWSALLTRALLLDALQQPQPKPQTTKPETSQP